MNSPAIDAPVCPSCGAVGTPGALQCALCGTAYDSDPEVPPVAATEGACPSCGHSNPAEASFCNQCGASLAAGPSRPEAPLSASPKAEASSAPGRQAVLVIATGLAVVVGLYGVTLLSERRAAEAPPASDVAAQLPAADPIPDGPAPPLPNVDNQTQADALEALDTAEGWYEAGRFYLTAAFEARDSDPVRSAQWTRRAVADFEQSLAIEPNADVQLAIAEASQFDPATPMRPVTELQSLLETYPEHIGANLMMGERRLQIGRLDSARVSFERVLALTDPGDPFRARAEQALATVAAQSVGS